MIRSVVREYLSADDFNPVVHQNVVDLAVRPVRRPGAADDGSSPARQHARRDRSPNIAVAGDDHRTCVNGELGSQPA